MYMWDNIYLSEANLKSARINCSFEEYLYSTSMKDRRLYLHGAIESVDDDGMVSFCGVECSKTSAIVEAIIQFNREDLGRTIDSREPIRLYINSPGGSVTEGFALVDAISLSDTPVYTINVGQWSSMAFLIGIAGHQRFSLPHASFLMHDGSTMAFGSANKMQDQMDFEKRFEQEVTKQHVLSHSNMSSEKYDELARVEYYMLPEDALKNGFIDKIVANINEIL